MMPRHTPRSSDYLQPRTILENLSWCPFGGTYVALHLNSIEKILNHLLALVLLLNIMLFLSSFSVVFMPLSAFNTTFISLLLLAQTVVVWLILNNHRVSFASCLAPTEFKIGVAFGLCVAAAILAFLVSHGFARPDAVCAAFQSIETANANQRFLVDNDPATNSTDSSSSSSSTTGMPFLSTYTICSTHKGSMVAVWFWSGLVFWCNFVSALLFWVGQSELANASPYENLSMDDFEDHFRRQQVVNGGAPPPAFVGDYATVPEIRTDESNLSQGMPHTSTSNSHLGGYNTSTNGFSDVAVTTTV